MIKETLHMSNYQLYSKRKSLIDPHKTIPEEAGFRCPHCHMQIKEPLTIEHGQTWTHDCGLTMTRYGNALECELEEK